MPTVAELVSGGAKGIDSYVKKFSDESGIKLVEFNPDYARYGRNAPLVRNTQIAQYADIVIAFHRKIHGALTTLSANRISMVNKL